MDMASEHFIVEATVRGYHMRKDVWEAAAAVGGTALQKGSGESSGSFRC